MNKILFGYHTPDSYRDFTKGMPIAIGSGRVVKTKPNKILWTQEQTTAPDFPEQTQRSNGLTARQPRAYSLNAEGI